MCLILLEEKNSARKDLMFKERNDLNISDGFIQLASKLAFLEGIFFKLRTFLDVLVYFLNVSRCIRYTCDVPIKSSFTVYMYTFDFSFIQVDVFSI